MRDFFTDVQLRLSITGGVTLDLAEVGPDYLILRDDCNIPPSNALLQIYVDGELETVYVFLFQGIIPGQRRVKYF